MLASTSRNVLRKISSCSSSALECAFTRTECRFSDPSPPASCSGPRLPQRRHASQALQQHPGPGSDDSMEASALSGFRGRRDGPWIFNTEGIVQPRNQSNQVARYNIRLSAMADEGRIIEVLRACTNMKQEGLTPNLTTYNCLLKACVEKGLSLEARAVFNDMQAMGIVPDRETFHYLLHVEASKDATRMWQVLETMQEMGIRANAVTFSLIIGRYTETENLEMALQYLAELNARGYSPALNTAKDIILLATRVGQPRLALDLADAFEQNSIRRLDSEVWLNCLLSSAEALYEEGVVQCWPKVVHDMSITPDEGLCIDVLHTAGRHGLMDLATDVVRVLKGMGAMLQEYHIAPLLEAFCRKNRIKDAFLTLNLLRRSNLGPSAETANPIFDAINQDLDTVDAAWAILDEMHADDEPIDVVALNVIIQASVTLGDLQRAVGTYKACPDFGVTPTVETYNLLLSGCIAAKHRALGDRLLADMKDASIQPNSRTYERLIALCLTQATYEDAFFYLEEMKGRRLLPTSYIYEAIIRKCVSLGDTRHKLAIEEMRELGYEMPDDLHRFIEAGEDRSIRVTAPMKTESKWVSGTGGEIDKKHLYSPYNPPY